MAKAVAQSAIPHAKPQRTSSPGTPTFVFDKEWGNGDPGADRRLIQSFNTSIIHFLVQRAIHLRRHRLQQALQR